MRFLKKKPQLWTTFVSVKYFFYILCTPAQADVGIHEALHTVRNKQTEMSRVNEDRTETLTHLQ